MKRMNQYNTRLSTLLTSVESCVNSLVNSPTIRKSDNVFLDHRTKFLGYRADESIKSEPEPLDEESFSEHLSLRKDVIIFTQDITFATIKKAFVVGMKSEDIATLMELKYMPENDHEGFPDNCILKPGYTHEYAVMMVKKIKWQNKPTNEIREIMGNGIQQMMASLWNITYSAEFALKCIEKDDVLKHKLIGFFRNVFNADLRFETIKEIIESNESNLDIIYDCFASANQTHLKSIQRKQLGNAKYIRQRQDKFKPEFMREGDVGPGHKSLFKDSGSSCVMKGNSKYNIDPGSNYARVMGIFKRKMLAGPSGSTVASFITTFEFVGLEKTSKNIALFLACSIANYIPAYHTLTEILMSFTDEVDCYMLPMQFDLKYDPVLYSLDVMEFHGIKIDYLPS